MDPVLSGSLCFLVLAIVMYIKFIREHPWADEDDVLGDRSKTSPVEPDTMPFLHPTSPVSVLQAQKKMHAQRQQQQHAQRNQGSQPVLRGPFKKVMQASAAAVGAVGASASAASTQFLHGKKQPMRRRTHSATLAGAAASGSGMLGGNGKSASVANSVAGGDSAGNVAMAMDQLPTTIYEMRQEHFHRDQKHPPPVQPAPPPSSGRNQHRINFDLSDEDEFDAEMGFLSPRKTSDAANDSLDSVPFEADGASDDGFTDLENRLGEFEHSDSEFHRTGGAGAHHQHERARAGSNAAAPPLVTPSKADTLKTTIDRQFVREAAAPPAQMQLEVARKARIPLFLHSPMYVRTSAAPLVDEVELLEKGDGEGIAAPVVPDATQDAAGAAAATPAAGAGGGAGQGAGAGAGQGTGVAVAGAAGGAGAAAAYAHARRRGKLPNKMKNQSLHIDFNELQVAEMIGQGAFGTVHRASWRGTTVAVKILVCQYLTVDILEEFETEVQIMSILRHPNICLLMGACLEPPTRCLVIEYLPRGSLWNVLRQDVVIDLKKQLGFARDTALGMNYLHSFQPPILHRDLKSPNLLIDMSYALKISDFGLARVRAHFQTMTGNCGTTQWMAPEVLAAEKYTEKADVFSYGVVVWETVTRECPYEGLSQIQAALGVLNNNLRPTIPENCPPLFKKIMTLCWVSNPEERPTFEAVLEILHRSSDGLLPAEDASNAHRGA